MKKRDEEPTKLTPLGWRSVLRDGLQARAMTRCEDEMQSWTYRASYRTTQVVLGLVAGVAASAAVGAGVWWML